MKRTYLSIYILLCAAQQPLNLFAQERTAGEDSLIAVLHEIGRHNPTLKALAAARDAATARNAVGLSLSDPEVEVAYLFGSPQGVPDRTNVSVAQPLDWSVLTGRGKAVAEAGDRVAQASYRQAAREVMAEADRTIVSLTYANRLCAELSRREAQARDLLRLMEERFAEGHIDRLELNKVRLNASAALADLRRAEADRQALLHDLARLNGGRAVEWTDTVYPYAAGSLPSLADLRQAAESSWPVVAAEAELRRSEAEVRLSKTESWPTLSVGFQGEYIKANNYSGLSVGLSIPLWGNSRRKVRAAKAEVATRQWEADEARQTVWAQIRQQHDLARSLALTAQKLKEEMAEADNALLLRRSLDEGRISLMDCLLELSFYYSARTACLEAERDACLAASRLRSLFY